MYKLMEIVDEELVASLESSVLDLIIIVTPQKLERH